MYIKKQQLLDPLKNKIYPRVLISTITVLFITSIGYSFFTIASLRRNLIASQASHKELTNKMSVTEKELSALKTQDQYKRNEELQDEIKNIQITYSDALLTYEKILDLRQNEVNTTTLEEDLAEVFSMLSKRNYASAEAKLTAISREVDKQTTSAAQRQAPSIGSVTTSNSPPSSGYSRQRVKTDFGEYVVDIVSADLSSTKVIVDTASDGTCTNDCPVLSLAEYVSRSGAYAGINGSYFCPASYPSCAGKTNSFDTLLMNKNKVYFNSENNVYSNVPVAAFGSGWARFMGRSSDWGRDTGVDGVIANQPLLVSGGNVAFGGDGDPKKGSKGTRSFIGANGSKVYIGVAHNVTVAEMAYVLKTLGMSDALNLDSGGSTALWSGGYKAGPGRNIPNAVLFVRR